METMILILTNSSNYISSDSVKSMFVWQQSIHSCIFYRITILEYSWLPFNYFYSTILLPLNSCIFIKLEYIRLNMGFDLLEYFQWMKLMVMMIIRYRFNTF